MTPLEEFAAHQQWERSLGDKQHLTIISDGHKWTMLLCAHSKAMLQNEIPAGLRLQLLEQIERMEDWWFTAPMIQEVQAMGPAEIEIYDQARSLDRDGDNGKHSFPVLVKSFDLFRRLNPSLNAAIRLKVDRTLGNHQPQLNQEELPQ